jgi:hypothetical protein
MVSVLDYIYRSQVESRIVHPVVSHLDRDHLNLTGGRVDASPEHLRPRFDGGTGVRTVATISSCMGSLYPHF